MVWVSKYLKGWSWEDSRKLVGKGGEGEGFESVV